MEKVLTYALDKMGTHSDSPWYRSTCLFVMEFQGVPDSGTANSAAVWSMITDRLQRQLSPRSWLHYDGNARLYCVTLGMAIEAAADYGEFLSTVLDEPLQLVDGSELSVDLRVGGAIARQTAPVTSQQLMTQAEKMLEKSSLWGRSRFRMIDASASS
ncbi:hypothetical protein [Acaryochloris sp. IP29b_bin.137]|uniref:hypothetical protein n=1 Tax=Acaryochloris sp. IP29b_bin.137 TaxID=2969217 RepID=UPI0026033BE3|nr:hypothetical protein [Acaryochloris sp. IP29b_bin.137]